MHAHLKMLLGRGSCWSQGYGLCQTQASFLRLDVASFEVLGVSEIRPSSCRLIGGV